MTHMHSLALSPSPVPEQVRDAIANSSTAVRAQWHLLSVSYERRSLVCRVQTLELWVLGYLLGEARALALLLLEIDEASRPIELVQRVCEQRPPIEPLLLLSPHSTGRLVGGGR